MKEQTVTIMSFVWGLAIAILLFRKCADGHCYVVHGPPRNEIENKVFKVEDECYRMTPKASKCEAK
jgi:hypothetical protein